MDHRAVLDLHASVTSDLRWLLDADLTQVDEATLRELSARLRRLLVDGTLQRLRKQVLGLRGEVRVTLEGPDALSPSFRDGATFWQAGGGNRGGVQIAGVQFWDRALSPEEVKAQYEAESAAMA